MTKLTVNSFAWKLFYKVLRLMVGESFGKTTTVTIGSKKFTVVVDTGEL